PTLFEKSVAGRSCVKPSDETGFDSAMLEGYLRDEPAELPEIAEVDLVRHYIGLSTRNFGVDSGFYPLGSCTMKYNPKINDVTSSLPGFTDLHPYQDPLECQGAMILIKELESWLSGLYGMSAFTLQPAAGAQGEFTGLLIIRKYLQSKGEGHRDEMLIPDSAHGTNPASAVMAGFKTVQVGSNDRGLVDLDDLKSKIGDKTAGIMLTNPNTLGLFEEDIVEIAELIHKAGGQLYYDGANANAISEIARPGDMGFDVLHLNLHKTFSTPHGGGGPGAGPVGVKKHLEPFLPNPRIEQDKDGLLAWVDRPESIGRMKTYFGNFLVCVRAYTYIRMLGAEGLRRMSEIAVLNANYLRAKISKFIDVPYNRTCMHEFVASPDSLAKETGIRTLDIAKALLDCKVHPPTTYFPLIVKEALMIEPTETESKETLDHFVETLRMIVETARTDPEWLHDAPHFTPVRRLDDVLAARKPNVCFIESGCVD
ncbi:MAG TPA: glycine dehydrogenase subunit 2, partial [Firmicutes bacterium]|nr:glycine dehydrogenase subunit 2 [Bacillota bacterium]